MRHQVETQKTAGPERYAVDHAAERLLAGEVSQGLLRTQRWLANRSSAARLPLPDLCGYVPLVELEEYDQARSATASRSSTLSHPSSPRTAS